jgi:hypothetical protein
MTCEHTTTNLPRNRCGIHKQMMDLRTCYWCNKNTTRGANGVPTWPESPEPAISRDPAVQANIARQQAGCRGCGDSPLNGI